MSEDGVTFIDHVGRRFGPFPVENNRSTLVAKGTVRIVAFEYRGKREEVFTPPTLTVDQTLTITVPNLIWLCPCPCGKADLADGIAHGMWTVADAAVQYRTCRVCMGTRPFMNPPIIEGQKVSLYHDPLSSEVSNEWDNLLDALTEGPLADVAELRRNGVILARAFVGIDGVLGWMVLPPL